MSKYRNNTLIMSEISKMGFITGYKRDSNQEDIYWLCNHPQSVDLIFSKEQGTAFVFENELTALESIKEILLAENRPWFVPIVQDFQSPIVATEIQSQAVSLEQTAAKIETFLKLFNERSHNRLELFLTLNKKDKTIRGYGTGIKIGDAVSHFVALLAIKGLKVQYLGKYTFIVSID
jgi:hypothetical protein